MVVLENINIPFPPTIVVVAGAIGLALFIVILKILKKRDSEDVETIDSEGLKKKFEKIFSDPVDSQGSKINDIVKMRGMGNTPRTVGLAYTGKKNDVEIVKNREKGEIETEKSYGYTYRIIEGSDKSMLKLKKFLTGFLGTTKYLETYDVPKKLIIASDKYIWFKPEAHFVKFNGVKRHFSLEGLGRAWEASFSKTHENYLETMGDIPEQYSVLNNRISGQLKIENVKSQNFKDFEKMKKDLETLDAMDS